jgi:DNA-binding response OmpR family regulator
MVSKLLHDVPDRGWHPAITLEPRRDVERAVNTIFKPQSRRTVLVVEDALTTRCILEQFFARAGCDVLQAGDPDTAMVRLRSTGVDAVILDLRLAEDRSGLEVLEQMRLDAQFDDVPVVVLTGVDEVEPEEAEVIDRHNAHLLYKRFGYREVVQRLEKILTAKAA